MEISEKNRIIGLNIGGSVFQTTQQTLTSFGENYFSVLVGGTIPSQLDKNGNYFIDRDGQYFTVLLEYLRTGDLVIPNGMKKSSVLREAEFYSIPITKNSKEQELRTDGMYCIGKEKVFYQFMADGNGITSLRDRFTWTRKDLLVSINFGSLARNMKFLLVEGKCPAFYRFQLKLMTPYRGIMTLVWEDMDVYIKGQLCSLVFDEHQAYCELDDGSIQVVTYKTSESKIKGVPYCEVLSFALSPLAPISHAIQAFEILTLKETLIVRVGNRTATFTMEKSAEKS
eukprot:TRINITY_DN9393_c0_g1_i1.p1 TRINITY_DN9393_c0_g1~~TRINITY_DN9393_c0_g1_i1.p1  ORF type:complete len:306 (-),score=51.70 TRINITY_DN9393_c0_g1_i1:121-972(-)